jgi:hypothetical protein
MALLPVGTAFGVAVAGPLALLTHGGSWRYAWLAFSVLALLSTLYNARTLPSGVGKRSAAGSATVGLRWFLRRPAAPLYLTSLSYGFIGSVYWTFAMDAIAAAGTIDAGREPVFWTLMGLAGIAGLGTGAVLKRSTVSGSAVDRFQCDRLLPRARVDCRSDRDGPRRRSPRAESGVRTHGGDRGHHGRRDASGGQPFDDRCRSKNSASQFGPRSWLHTHARSVKVLR